MRLFCKGAGEEPGYYGKVAPFVVGREDYGVFVFCGGFGGGFDWRHAEG